VDRVIGSNKAESKVCKVKIKESQQKYYDTEYAGLSANFLGFENWRISYIRRIFAELGVTRKDRLLDVGVGGTGFTVISGALSGTFSVGIDISEVACVKAREYASQTGASLLGHFLVSSATHLPFQDEVFSKVISNAVLEHVEDDDCAFDELGRILEHKGRVLICVPNSYMFMAWPLALLNLWNDRRVGHLRHYASTDLVLRGARRGLEAIDVTFHAHSIKIVQTICSRLFASVRNPTSRLWWYFERFDLDGKADLSGMNVTVTFAKGAKMPLLSLSS
jgi:ubiquinone/menaquinone biosynthesis C-methylase UbiE